MLASAGCPGCHVVLVKALSASAILVLWRGSGTVSGVPDGSALRASGLPLALVVFLTAAVTNEELTSHQGKIGGAPYVAKPVELNALIDCIEQNLARQPRAGTPNWRSTPARGVATLYSTC